ncbi:isocitrate/isopropylmalate family dehydrogenase [Cutibacterium acnes]|nr:isocitrate/isopropylmalate family dehydrogenase [Cutibacterium acnes]
MERVVRDAFARAAARRGHLTLVHKHNVLVNAGTLWRRIVDEVVKSSRVSPLTTCTSTLSRSLWYETPSDSTSSSPITSSVTSSPTLPQR